MHRIKNRLIILFTLVAVGIFMTSQANLFASESSPDQGCDYPDCSKPQDEHTDCDHDDHKHESHTAHDKHSGCDHAEHEDQAHDHDEHSDCEHGHSEIIQLDPESERLIDIQTVHAQAGLLSSMIRLTGQIRMNQDKLAHIVPLTYGIVRQVNKQIGDSVQKNEILAWIESKELAQAKVTYLDIQAEIGCCLLNLTRAQAIHDSTQQLINLLESNPALDELRKTDGLEMGENRSRLVKAYVEYTIAKSSYEREKPLYEQNISSKEEYLNAENRFKKAEAEYIATLDTVQFQIRQNLLEAQGEQNRQEIALKGAKRTLYILGQTDEDIERLDLMALSTSSIEQPKKSTCPDPNCEACRKKTELAAKANDLTADYHQLGWYPLRAGFNGTIIDKHITLGERLSEETIGFTIANLNTVWIDFNVFPKDLPHVKKGQSVVILLGNQNIEAELMFVSPILNPETRTATARVILNNSKGILYPGQFVTAQLNGKTHSGGIVIPQKAIQVIKGKKCVFVKIENKYEPRKVTVGQSNKERVEIISGLKKGESVVTDGAFELKSKIVTSTLDSHAGHGH